MKNVIVIHEKDLTDKEQIVIGVASDIKHAESLLKLYYGDYKETLHNDIRDSNIEYIRILEVNNHLNDPYKVEIALEWFIVDEL